MDLESNLFNIQVLMNMLYPQLPRQCIFIEEVKIILRIISTSTVNLIWLQLTIFLSIQLKIFMAKEIQQPFILISVDLLRLGAINSLESPVNNQILFLQINIIYFRSYGLLQEFSFILILKVKVTFDNFQMSMRGNIPSFCL